MWEVVIDAYLSETTLTCSVYFVCKVSAHTHLLTFEDFLSYQKTVKIFVTKKSNSNGCRQVLVKFLSKARRIKQEKIFLVWLNWSTHSHIVLVVISSESSVLHFKSEVRRLGTTALYTVWAAVLYDATQRGPFTSQGPYSSVSTY